ncbi:hypothetical protein Q7A53_03540 [Halobacillus rhizosphaerae]|uniref:hypothetical protein n=1 Tax=Halobacillus rhizosphaerae TaxID=3064889 RepID=UPI00398B2921
MGLTYGKLELMEDLQKVFAKHNVQAIKVNEPGTLFLVQADGSLTVGTSAVISAFEFLPGEKPSSRFTLINGGNKKN